MFIYGSLSDHYVPPREEPPLYFLFDKERLIKENWIDNVEPQEVIVAHRVLLGLTYQYFQKNVFSYYQFS